MIGFNYRNLMLQIIQGSVIVCAILIMFRCEISYYFNGGFLKEYAVIIGLALLILAFSIGAFVDFITDMLELLLMFLSKWEPILTPPIYYLLTKESWFGISLAHNRYIFDKLCCIAAIHDMYPGTLHEKREKYKREFEEERNLKTINYLLQVAKNKAFKKCKPYQKDQIESFFVLYIFARNLSLSLLIAMGLCFSFFPLSCMFLSVLAVFSSIASYRYYLYYIRVLLGSTIF